MRRTVCVAVACVVLGCGDRVESEDPSWEVSPPLVLLNVSAVEFAPTRVGAVASAVVRVMNAGDSPLRVESASVSGFEFAVSPSSWVGLVELEPGESRIISVVYVPYDRGVDEGALVLETNSPDAPTIRLPVRGEGVRLEPRVEAPREVTLTPTRALEGSYTVFSIRNDGEAELLLDGPRVEATRPGDLVIRYPDPGAPNDPSRDSLVASPGLNPGDALRIRAVFTPELPGAHRFTLRWATNDLAREELVITLSGEADAPALPPRDGLDVTRGGWERPK